MRRAARIVFPIKALWLAKYADQVLAGKRIHFFGTLQKWRFISAHVSPLELFYALAQDVPPVGLKECRRSRFG